jgi:hypothetical protein
MTGIQVTLTDADTNYDLLTLVRGVDSGFKDVARQITIQADASNSVAVLIGDANLSATRYGARLDVTDALALTELAYLKGLNARASASGQKLNILISR